MQCSRCPKQEKSDLYNKKAIKKFSALRQKLEKKDVCEKQRYGHKAEMNPHQQKNTWERAHCEWIA